MATRIVIASICAERGNLENNKFHSIFCYFFLNCLLTMTSFLLIFEPCNKKSPIDAKGGIIDIQSRYISLIARLNYLQNHYDQISSNRLFAHLCR
ncbi:hypothetical protein [Rickettsia endosymbiont of Orchestes rusci]|uniref:hypothetical protein n=1 Tax=Rickettsia endosymbiont of Orchestes rusci TaxID=3066250 RepID=UPI00313E0855